MKVRIFTTSLLLLARQANSKINSQEPNGLEIDGDESFLLDLLESSKLNAQETEGLGLGYDAGKYDIGLPQPVPEKIFDKIPISILEPFFPIEPCTEEGKDYVAPITTTDMADEYFDENVGGTENALEKYQPNVVVIVGGSSGIGRALACYWAERGKTVLSLGARAVELIGKNQPSKIECEAASRIINVQYDVSKPKKQRKLSLIFKEHGIESIDFLLLNAGRGIFGSMRDWSADDLTRAYMTNVWGLHEVWRQAREFLNPDLAVVFGLSSQMAENQALALANVYSHTKKAVYDLMIAYAQEEAFVQPNTHYAAIVQGGAGSSISLNYLAPTGPTCQAEYSKMAVISNLMWQFEGLRINKIARMYHKGYARIAAAADLNPGSREDIPQAFTFQNATSFLQTDTLLYNNRELRPEQTNACYANGWDSATEYFRGGCKDEKTGLPLCPFIGELIVPYLDPRVPLKCASG